MIHESVKRYFTASQNIHEDADIGEGCTIHSHVWIGKGVVIGECCKIQAFAFIPDGVKIGNNVFIGPHVCFTNDKYPPSHGVGWLPTTVEDSAAIGANATILPGITLGTGCTIGAGSVVTKNVAPHKIVKGNPAK